MARLGKLEITRTVAAQIKQLSAKEFGGELLLDMLNSLADEEDD
ncbi:MAG: hypothetical protein AAFR24_08135 [Cyanobacteria bacterium J06627_3]